MHNVGNVLGTVMRRVSFRLVLWMIFFGAIIFGLSTWLHVWYINSSKVLLQLPTPSGNVSITGSVYLVELDWGWYAFRLRVPYSESLLCTSNDCDILDLPRGKYTIRVTNMPSYDDWEGSMRIVSGTIGSFEIPAKSSRITQEFTFGASDIQTHTDDRAYIEQAYPKAIAFVYNPFDRVSYFRNGSKNNVFDHKNAVRYDIVASIPEGNIHMVKRLDQGFGLTIDSSLYVYLISQSIFQQLEGIRDQAGHYTLTNRYELTNNGTVIVQDMRIRNIFWYDGMLIMDMQGQYITYVDE